MTGITQIRLPDGQVIWARLSGQDGPRDVGFGERARVLAAEEFSRLAGAVIGNVRNALLQYEADEVCIDFGIELSVQSGKVIGALAEVGGTSSIVVHLSWKGQPGSPQPDGSAAPPG
jgi:hypothetical protein